MRSVWLASVRDVAEEPRHFAAYYARAMWNVEFPEEERESFEQQCLIATCRLAEEIAKPLGIRGYPLTGILRRRSYPETEIVLQWLEEDEPHEYVWLLWELGNVYRVADGWAPTPEEFASTVWENMMEQMNAF